jgi:NurA domain
MQGIGQHLNQEAVATRQRLDLAHQLLQQAKVRQADLETQQQIWHDRLGFTAATPLEPLDTCIDLIAAPPIHTVIATDGSQIAPSHHEIAYCYLVNTGRVVLHYGQNRHPLLDSLPEVFYRPEDLYVSRQWGIRTEEWMGYRRTVSEAVVLAELGKESRAVPNSPTLAMVDGSLIHWFLEPLPGDARDRILPPMLAAWDQLREARIPLVGYLSAARSGEALNFLRLHTCPYLAPDCNTHCSGQTDQAPCQVFSPLRDTALWSMLLQPGQRSLIWRSSAKILEVYGDHAIYFCYVHMGSEVARIEFPAWVAEDSALLDSALSLTLTQVQKGYGYPVALAEAHNQAVVRGGDRARFFAILEQQMIRAGLKNIGTSYKEARKRGSIA